MSNIVEEQREIQLKILSDWEEYKKKENKNFFQSLIKFMEEEDEVESEAPGSSLESEAPGSSLVSEAPGSSLVSKVVLIAVVAVVIYYNPALILKIGLHVAIKSVIESAHISVSSPTLKD